MRFGLLVGDCAQCIGQGDNFIFFNVANIISSDLPLRNSKKIFIDLFCVLGNLKHFLFFFHTHRTKKE